MEKLLGFLQELMMTAGMKIIAAILVLVIGFKLVNVFVKALKKSKSFSKIDKTAQDFLLSVLSVTLKVVIALTSAAILGVSALTRRTERNLHFREAFPISQAV